MFKNYITLTRPFTLVLPIIAFISAGIIAIKSINMQLLLGGLAIAFLNAASNELNQIFDINIDKINKPNRPLPSKKISLKNAFLSCLLLYIISLLISYFINSRLFIIFIIITIFTITYSAPPFRFKRIPWISNLNIAIPRGLIIIVAGWASVKPITFEPIFIGLIYTIYLFGAQSTKDFSDIKGDKKYNIITLPILYGKTKTISIMIPFLTLPFLLIPIGISQGILTGNPLVLLITTTISLILGIRTSIILRKNTKSKASWIYMYYTLFITNLGFAIAYVV
jgi:geranylgeranylglycerol-phosphate geranylgeranyltransferase